MPNSGLKLKDQNGKNVKDGLGKQKFRPNPPKVGNPLRARLKKIAREAYLKGCEENVKLDAELAARRAKRAADRRERRR